MKRLVALLLSAALAVGLAPSVLAAAEDVPEREKAAVLRELKVMVGNGAGELRLDAAVTRAEFTKMLVTASVWKDSVGRSVATSPYPDVPYTRWYAPYVRAAVDAGLVKGDLLGYFHPDSTINLGEGATMLVRLLGYQDGEFSAYRWPEGQLAQARAAKLTAGVSAQNAQDELSRRDCLHLFYNLLTADTKTGTPYIYTLGHTLNADGEVDLNALFGVERDGPIPLTGDYQALLPFDPAEALVFRDEKRAELSELREWDILYWTEDPDILFAVSSGAMGQLSAAVEGPLVVEGDGWRDQLPFTPEEAASVTRNGSRAGWQDIREGDVVYWSKYARSLTAYCRRVTGTVEAVTPTLAAPTGVVIAGQSYPLETLAAQYAFSDLGPWRKGDTVTLLLGRTGGAAAVRAAEEGDRPQVGVVTGVGKTTYTDGDGRPYTAGSVTLTATDGQSYTYRWDGDEPEVGALVQAVQSETGTTLETLTEKGLSGRVDQEAKWLGSLPLAADAEILDTYGERGILAVPRSRLAGVRLTEDKVRWYARNGEGEVEKLVLDNVTGDLHRYGILTQVKKVGVGLAFQNVYTYLLGGRELALAAEGKDFNVSRGPVRVWTDGQGAEKLSQLLRMEGVTLSERKAVSGGQSGTLADDVSYYIYDAEARSYASATRSQVTAGGYTLTAWYDAPDAQGGRVRVIVAQEK